MPERGRPNKPAIKERKWFGIHACLALFQMRRDDIIRVYVRSGEQGRFKELLSWAAKARLAYHLVDNEELSKVAGTEHHEGICILARERRHLPEQKFLDAINAGTYSGAIVFLDGVVNPHNVGNIVRTLAHFGVEYLLFHREKCPSASGSLARVAEGATEYLSFVPVTMFDRIFKELKAKGYKAYTTAARGAKSIFEITLPPKSILIIGAEAEGVSPQLQAFADCELRIPGSGRMESLNVSVATGIMLAHWFSSQEV